MKITPPDPLARRKFLTDASLVAAGLVIGRRSVAQSLSSDATLEINASAPGIVVSPDFIGLSYENMQLEDPLFFSAKNRGLVEQFRNISPRGVLRLGGNTSEFEWWKATADQPAPERRLVLKNGDKPQDTLYAITPEAIRELDGFLKATGWTCIYGLNLGFGTPETDVAEARFVFETLGPRLEYFQIGNEVDLFIQYHLRDASIWTFDTYLQQWLIIARAVQKAIPDAKFGIPDVSGKVEWLTDIAEQWPSLTGKPNVTTLSHHYYWSGPPSNPDVTVANLLKGSPKVVTMADIAVAAASKIGMKVRLTEANTVYRGGKYGVSDVFASALWAADYVLSLMALGYCGVNLHGGSGHAQAVSVGGTFVGEADMKNPDEPHPKPFYTPIANEGTLAGSGVNGKLNSTYLLEPTGYGLKFVSEFAGGTLLPIDFNPGPVNATAYSIRLASGPIAIVLINKDASQPLTVHLQACKLRHVLTAPSLTAREAHIVTDRAAAALVKVRASRVTVPPGTAAKLILT